ncbi:MAG: TIGR01777 family oxidoreductase [Prolixibacteraceae bacterium]
MKIVITGGTGFIGRHLSAYLNSPEDELVLIQRSDLKQGTDRISKIIKSSDVLINLAGSPVIKRWTAANKKNILESRLETTNLLVRSMQVLPASERPKVFISASAIGIYDSFKIHSEASADFDHHFLSSVCQQWEKCLQPLSAMDTRVCIVRIGIVLGREGGMLKQLLPIFKVGLGGKIGSGTQGFSFIHYHDLCRAIEYLIENSACEGIFNLTAPKFSSNAIFTKVLAKACHRPAIFTVPEFALKLVYGQAAVSLIQGQSVYPQHLLDCGFKFQYPDTTSAIEAILAK